MVKLGDEIPRDWVILDQEDPDKPRDLQIVAILPGHMSEAAVWRAYNAGQVAALMVFGEARRYQIAKVKAGYLTE